MHAQGARGTHSACLAGAVSRGLDVDVPITQKCSLNRMPRAALCLASDFAAVKARLQRQNPRTLLAPRPVKG